MLDLPVGGVVVAVDEVGVGVVKDAGAVAGAGGDVGGVSWWR